MRTRVHGSSRIINKIGENVYKLKLLDDYDISPIFNVKDLRPYYGEDFRANLFPNYGGFMQELVQQTLGIQS